MKIRWKNDFLNFNLFTIFLKYFHQYDEIIVMKVLILFQYVSKVNKRHFLP